MMEKPPAVASGIRLGTPIVSTRGMREAEMKENRGADRSRVQNRQNAAVLEESVRKPSTLRPLPNLPLLLARLY